MPAGTVALIGDKQTDWQYPPQPDPTLNGRPVFCAAGRMLGGSSAMNGMVYSRGMSEKAREQRRRASALGIEGTGWDIGHAVRFLMSDHARYITGQTLVVDGGVTLQAPERESQSE